MEKKNEKPAPHPRFVETGEGVQFTLPEKSEYRDGYLAGAALAGRIDGATAEWLNGYDIGERMRELDDSHD